MKEPLQTPRDPKFIFSGAALSGTMKNTMQNESVLPGPFGIPTSKHWSHFLFCIGGSSIAGLRGSWPQAFLFCTMSNARLGQLKKLLNSHSCFYWGMCSGILGNLMWYRQSLTKS